MKPLSLLDPTAALRAIISVPILHLAILVIFCFESSAITKQIDDYKLAVKKGKKDGGCLSADYQTSLNLVVAMHMIAIIFPLLFMLVKLGEGSGKYSAVAELFNFATMPFLFFVSAFFTDVIYVMSTSEDRCKNDHDLLF